MLRNARRTRPGTSAGGAGGSSPGAAEAGREGPGEQKLSVGGAGPAVGRPARGCGPWHSTNF